MDKNVITGRGIYLLVSLFIGVFLLSNFIDFQHTLSASDHGLVLYAAEATLRGELPFRDYHYFYGPFMPYYYGVIMKLFGHSIGAVLIGEQFLRLSCGLLVYSAISLFVHPLFALLGSIWYWVFNREFFYTYNHAGINVASLFVFYMLCSYLKNNSHRSIYWGLLACLIAGLIKLNFGVALTFILFAGVFVINTLEKRPHRIKLYLWIILGTPSLILLTNMIFLNGLPFYIIRQCYQYFGTDAVLEAYPSTAEALLTLGKKAGTKVIKSWFTELLLVSIAVLGVANIYQLKKGRWKDLGHKQPLLAIGLCFIFGVVLLHEYLVSGIEFRSFYVYPFLFVVAALGLGTFGRNAPRFVQHTVAVTLCAVSLAQFTVVLRNMDVFRTPASYLALDKARVFVTNLVPWTQTVTQATLYLKKELKEDELFLALPNDPLYYFLLDRKSPTRQLVTHKFLLITPEQDESIVQDLEAHKVNWILLSNRAVTYETGLGVLGRDYAPALAKYVYDNFEVVAQFGEWTARPSWAWHHGVRILKRKDPS